MTKRKTRRRSRSGSKPRTVPRAAVALVAEWAVPLSASLGSTVRAQGIEREIRAKLPWLTRTCLTVESGRAVLGMPEGSEAEFEDASRIVAGVMAAIETLPMLPSEVEDILTITAHERQKWLKDGRLKSAGTRTVKLRGRAKAVTFHVFDPREIEDVLDRDLATLWREEDAQAKAENRRRAAARAAQTRAGKGAARPTITGSDGSEEGRPPRLVDWDAFATEGFLR